MRVRLRLHRVDGSSAPAYVPVIVQEKVPSPLKDIAIYRLQRVDKALERLNAAVARLEAAVQSKGPDAAKPAGENVQALADAKAEIKALRGEYESLHAVASSVADKLDGTIDQLKAEAAADAR